MIAIGLGLLLVCGHVGSINITDDANAIIEGLYCDLTKGGLGICQKEENCHRGSSARREKCASPFVCCPLPGQKSREKCEEYSRIEKSSICVEDDPLIVKSKESPHMVAVGYKGIRNNVWRCAGLLISERYVLTAGQCAKSTNDFTPRRVRIGDIEQADREAAYVQQVTIEEVIPHPKYEPLKHDYDIALLKLARDVEFNSYVRPACLYTSTEPPANRAVILRWAGYSSTDPFFLLKSNLPFVSDKTCKEHYKGDLSPHRGKFDGNSMICAGISCMGDAGSPLQVRKSGPGCMVNVVGVSSFGLSLCGSREPGIFTRVSHYIPWIESVVWH